jgi:hypothetical protein
LLDASLLVRRNYAKLSLQKRKSGESHSQDGIDPLHILTHANDCGIL